MKQTVLSENHRQRAAKTVELDEWILPSQFSDPSEEHHAVRTAAGLFDIGFLGRIEILGAAGEPLLDRLFTRNVPQLAEGRSIFGLFLNETGGIMESAILTRLPAGKTDRRYLLTTNSKNTDKMFALLTKNKAENARIADRTAATAHIALQGPRADMVLEAVAETSFRKLKPKNAREITVAGIPALVMRIGFTGERGFEFVVSAEQGPDFWEAILQAGANLGLVPCGIICREILRLEAGFAAYGADIDESRTPLEAGLAKAVDFSKEFFIGKEALIKRKAEGVKEKLIGFEVYDKGIPKQGGAIFSENREIGVVTSGVHSPSRRKDIGLGYVENRYAQPGQEIEVEIKDREITAKIIELPFYRRK